MKPLADIDVLIVGYFANALSQSEFALLQKTLRTSANARLHFAEIARHDVLLHRILTGKAALVSPDRFKVSSGVSPNTLAKRLQWLPPLALAAGLLVAFGLFFFLHSSADQHGIGRLTHAVGPVYIEDTGNPGGLGSTIKTPPGSLARLEQSDGTMIAMAGDTHLEWRTSLVTGIKTLGIAKGQAILDIVPQMNPFFIESFGGIQAQVQGTRIWTASVPNGEERTHVFSGQLLVNRRVNWAQHHLSQNDLKHQTGDVSVYLGAGQTMSHFIPAANVRGTAVYPFGTRLDPLDWVQQLGLDATLWPDGRVPSSPNPSLPDVSYIGIMSGTWEFIREGHSVRAVYSMSDIDSGTISIGPHQWVEGDFSCMVKLPEIKPTPDGEPVVWIGISFQPYNNHGIIGALPVHEARAGLYQLTGSFELQRDNNALHFKKIMMRARHRTGEEFTVLNQTVQGLEGAIVREGAPGIYILGTAAEFSDFRLENAVAAPSLPNH